MTIGLHPQPIASDNQLPYNIDGMIPVNLDSFT
ncbi:UDP-glycosyltransferase 73B4-like protein [Corchorus olitorius]|uniref:UDP-glycosyltransferase 73B4-like protein n=1 Tax=Corchorus olitorius TaxID=93759 RepID=A0A1R3L1N1_9ROSI|nr:UDP-glycosyltransferase 73B4-like protein [Corchorus olitorius]